MPLNPPTHKGPDVYYSTNVFVNKVPVALWKPPAGAFNDGSPGTDRTPEGGSGYNDNPYGREKSARETLRTQGALIDEPEDNGSTPSSPVSPTGPIQDPKTTPAKGPDPNPSAPVPTGNYQLKIDDLPNTFPKRMNDSFYDQSISQYFKMRDIRNVPIATAGLSARQIAANFIVLCQQVLDPIYAQWKFDKDPINSAFRPTTPGSDHGKGFAVDINAGGKAKNRKMFRWICANSSIKYWQIIYEETSPSTGSGWVHVSYKGGAVKPDSSNTMWTTNAGSKPPKYNHVKRDGSDMPSWLQ